nr:DsbA family protein [Alicyclobacillus mengziensis]
MEDEWVSFEIHPETPPEGVSMDERFPKSTREQMYARLSASGERYGLTFTENSRLSNSHLALEASEFARDAGNFHAFHTRIFKAYFSEGRDIGDRKVLSEIAKDSGVDVQALNTALDEGRYTGRLEEGQYEGQRYGVTGTPTFIINDKYKVVGAQPIEVMRKALQEIADRESANEDNGD